MPIIKIHNKEYDIHCAPGEEERLKELAARLNARLSSNARTFGGVNEGLLMVLTAIIMEDELEEVQKNNQEYIDLVIKRIESLIRTNSK